MIFFLENFALKISLKFDEIYNILYRKKLLRKRKEIKSVQQCILFYLKSPKALVHNLSTCTLIFVSYDNVLMFSVQEWRPYKG